MKYIFSIVLLLITSDIDPARISKLNELKEKARLAYESGDFEGAIQHYKFLLDSMEYDSDVARLNLSNAYYQARDTMNSKTLYQQLSQSVDRKVRSIANQQLGVMANGMDKKEKALDYFKNALRADPTNEEARYNYELLKKQLQEEQEQDQQNQDQQNQDQQNQDQQNQEQQNQEQQNQEQQNQEQQNQEQQNQEQQNQEQQNQEQQNQEQQNQEQQNQEQQNQEQQNQEQQNQEQQNSEDQEGEQDQSEDQQQENKDQEGKEEQKPGEEQPELTEEEKKKLREQTIKEMLEKMNLSPEKARMILDAMKSNEVQYLQQNKRKPTKKKENNKPDW